MTDVSLVKLPSDECNWILLMISQHWFRYWLGAVRQQAITWANVDPDLCRHMTSLGPNELIIYDMSCYLYPAVMIILMIDYTFSNNFSYSFWHFLLDFSEFHSVELVLYIELNRIDSITGPVEPPYTLRNTQVLGPVPCKKKKALTHWGLVTPYGDGDLGQHWFR